MKISIITASRNEAARINKCLRSVSDQKHRDIEHIIVDGQSTDGTAEQIKSFANGKKATSVRVITTQPCGVYDALNTGTKSSTGQIVGLLHANDAFADNDVLTKINTAFETHPEVDIVYGDIHFVNNKDKCVRRYSGKAFQPHRLLDGFAFPHTSMFVRREMFDKHGLYDLHFPVAADFEWIVRTVLKGKARTLYIPLDMVCMTTGGLSGRLINKLWHNRREKLQALRINGYNVSPLRLFRRYLHL